MIILINAKEQERCPVILYLEQDKGIKGKGPVGKFLVKFCKELMKICKLNKSVINLSSRENEIEKILSAARNKRTKI